MARLTHERRHQQILDTAIDVFADFGFRGTTTKQIAKAAGVSEATIFLHFPSKEALYQAILEEVSQSQEPLRGLLDADGDAPLADLLARLAQAFQRRQRKDSALVRLALFSALERHTLGRRLVDQHLAGPVQGLTRLIQRAQEHGEVRADLDPKMAARALDSMLVHQVLLQEVLGEKHVSSGDMQSYVDIYLRGIAPRDAQEE
ncbi:MAG: TetR/AcrR family transcriptional regulator [Gemmatimonadetes bacterium]|nr:TetR/AcrR family transcriptional regulator [Gemmatimonadota bacterium]